VPQTLSSHLQTPESRKITNEYNMYSKVSNLNKSAKLTQNMPFDKNQGFAKFNGNEDRMKTV